MKTQCLQKHAKARTTVAPRRSGISLMEVLISVFVIAIGLLGIAALIPVANYALIETSKSDRTAACGQAAIRDVRVRRLADPKRWDVPTVAASNPFATGATYVVDPLGGIAQFGAVLKISYLPEAVKPVFEWQDDKTFESSADGSRPVAVSYGGQDYQGDFSWMFTVTPSPAEDYDPGAYPDGWLNRRHLAVSVVIFHKRDFTGSDIVTTCQDGTTPLTGKFLGSTSALQLNCNAAVETGQWILLTGQRMNHVTGVNVAVADWYRVVSGSGLNLTLEGPDWRGNSMDVNVVIVPGVLGVYTTTVELDRTPAWWR